MSRTALVVDNEKRCSDASLLATSYGALTEA